MPTGVVQFTSTSQRLAEDVRELVLSLGHRCGFSTKRVRGSHRGIVHRRTRCRSAPTTRSSGSSASACCTRSVAPAASRARRSRFITEVRPITSVPVRCLQVDAPDHLFLAARSMIPTHNSTMGLDIARSASIKQRTDVGHLLARDEPHRDHDAHAERRGARSRCRSCVQGRLEDSDWTKMARTMGELSDAPLFIDDCPNMSLMEIRAKCRRLKQRHDLKLVIIDYLQLMSSGKRVESRQQEVSEFSRAAQAARQGARGPGDRDQPAQPWARAAHRQEAADERPSRVGLPHRRHPRAAGRHRRGDRPSASCSPPAPPTSRCGRWTTRCATCGGTSPTSSRPASRRSSGCAWPRARRCAATANHPFLTYDGWRPLDELASAAAGSLSRAMCRRPSSRRPLVRRAGRRATPAGSPRSASSGAATFRRRWPRCPSGRSAPSCAASGSGELAAR